MSLNPTPRVAHSPHTHVAIVIPILNESLTLGRCLASIAHLDYPSELLEVIIVDGGSTDSWRGCLAPLKWAGIEYRVISNPKRNTSAAVNLALDGTSSEAILWLSGHCMLAPAYLCSLVDVYEHHDNVVVGGCVRSEGIGMAGALNAMVLSSAFGTGLANWRTRPVVGWARSASYALYSRRTLLELGGLDERLIRNQDTDLVKRLARLGVRFYTTDASVVYLAPPSLSILLKKAWGNGAWGIWSWRLGRRSFSAYHLAPGVAVALGLASGILGLWLHFALAILAGLILLYSLLASAFAVARAGKDGKLWLAPALVLWFAAHHGAYGLGTITAIFLPVPRVHRPELRLTSSDTRNLESRSL